MSYSGKWADIWLETFETLFTGSTVLHDRGPVRVAILGFGVDVTHPDLRKALAEHRIGGCRSFPNSLSSSPDNDGSGTHAASVLLKMAPTAILFMAQVGDDESTVEVFLTFFNILLNEVRLLTGLSRNVLKPLQSLWVCLIVLLL
jgi:hypothetical protein